MPNRNFDVAPFAELFPSQERLEENYCKSLFPTHFRDGPPPRQTSIYERDRVAKPAGRLWFPFGWGEEGPCRLAPGHLAPRPYEPWSRYMVRAMDMRQAYSLL